jgi:hypothetical protein
MENQHYESSCSHAEAVITALRWRKQTNYVVSGVGSVGVGTESTDHQLYRRQKQWIRNSLWLGILLCHCYHLQQGTSFVFSTVTQRMSWTIMPFVNPHDRAGMKTTQYATSNRARRGSEQEHNSVCEGKNGYMEFSKPPPAAKKQPTKGKAATKSKSTTAADSAKPKKSKSGKKKGSEKEFRELITRRPRFLVWDESFQELLDYAEEHGDCHVPQSYAANERLGRWVARQRTFFRQWQDFHMIQGNSKERIADPGDSKATSAIISAKAAAADMTFVNTARPITSNPLATNQTRITLLNDIGFAWNVNDMKWKQRFKELKEFQKQLKHCNVPVHYKQNRPLGIWVNNQRLQYKGGVLSSERIKKLEDMGFAWSSQLADQQWQERFEELQDFHGTYGHVNVPEKYDVNQALAYWVTSQRKQHKKMQQRQSSMRDSMTQLQDGDVDEEEEDGVDDEDDLSSPVPNTTKRQPILSKNRIDALHGLGFVWNIFDARWKERYDMLVKYKNKNEDCLVPAAYPKNPELACWVLNQRTQYRYYRNGESTGLTEDRIDKLEELGFVWHDREITWNKMLQWMEDYIQSHPRKSCFVPPSDLENRPLRIWAKNQRYDHNKMSDPASYSPMTPERVEALNRIGFQWAYHSKRPSGPSVKEWGVLFDKLREKGIAPEAKAKTHWFDGEMRAEIGEWDTDVYKLWNDEDEEEEEEEDAMTGDDIQNENSFETATEGAEASVEASSAEFGDLDDLWGDDDDDEDN